MVSFHKAGDIGLIVSYGGFTSDEEREIRLSRRWTLSELSASGRRLLQAAPVKKDALAPGPRCSS